MFQVNSHKAAHHQQNKIEHFQYENQLLMQRNQLLASQNQRLLQQVQMYQKKNHQKDVGCVKEVIWEIQGIKKTSREELSRLKKNSGKDARRIIMSILDETQCEDQISFKYFFRGMLELVKSMSSEILQLKSQRVRHQLSERQERLASRRNARERTERVLHVVKQPHESLFGWNPKQISQELNHQRQFFERIIRKVRKDSIHIHELQGIYNKIDEFNRLRWSMKNQETELSLHERQFELGSIEPFTLEQTVNRIAELSEQLSLKRMEIDEKIISL